MNWRNPASPATNTFNWMNLMMTFLGQFRAWNCGLERQNLMFAARERHKEDYDSQRG